MDIGTGTEAAAEDGEYQHFGSLTGTRRRLAHIPPLCTGTGTEAAAEDDEHRYRSGDRGSAPNASQRAHECGREGGGERVCVRARVRERARGRAGSE